MNKLLEFLRPIDTLIWNYFVKSKFILFCGGGKSADPVYVEPRDMGEDARSYLETITDPELVGKQLNAEKEFGPQFDLVSLSRTQIMLEGIKDPKESQAYGSATARRIALQAKKKALEEGQETMSQEDIDRQIEAILGPAPNKTYEYRGRGNYKETRENPEYVAYQERKAVLSENYSSANNSDLAEVEGELAGVIETITQIENQPAQKGLIEMAEDTAKAYDKIIADSNTFKRERDILDMEYFGQQATDATRASDPYSTGIAEKTTELSDKLTDRALADTEQSEERMKMGQIADRQAARIDDLEKISEDLRTPKENEELNNLKNLRDQQQKSLLDPSLDKALDPNLSKERRDLRTIADQSMLAAEGPTGVAFDRQQSNQQSLADMSMDSATSSTARANNPMLAEGRGELGSLADQAQGFAMNPTSNEERAQLGDMAQQSRDFADSLMAEAQNPALPNEERQRLINMSQNQEQRANELYSRAGDVSPEQQQLRNQATSMQQRAQSLFEQAESAPSAQKRELQNAARDMMERGKGLFEQSKTTSLKRAQAGSLAQLSAKQAKQLTADATGPLSSQRRRLAEQAARQQGLRTGRIGDNAQLASELLNREESRAALRDEARKSRDLAFTQASTYATDAANDSNQLRTSALGYETGGFDRARGVESDIDEQKLNLLQEGRLSEGQAFDAGLGIEGQISDQETSRNAEARATAGQSFDMGREIQTDLDDLTETRRDQALDARGDARDATTDLITIDKGFRDESEERQQALLDRDESLRKEARLDREAASLEQRGLYEQAKGLREEADEAREAASDAVQTVADIDASFRAEGRQNIGDAIGLGAGLAEAEENLRQTNLDEQADIRGEISDAESTAFANQGVLANFDSAVDQNKITNALDSSKTSFNMNQAVGDNSMLAGTSTAPNMGATAVAGAPGVSQGFQPLFQGAIGTGINIGQVNRANEQDFENTKARIAADNRASSRSTFGTLVKAGAAMLPIPGASKVTEGIN